MKYVLLLCLLHVAFATESVEDELIPENESEEMQSAQFMNPMMMGGMGMGMGQGMGMGMGPGMGMGMPMSRSQFPVDYSMGCSNTCSCMSRCQIMWWMPCMPCWCPPTCDNTTPDLITEPTTPCPTPAPTPAPNPNPPPGEDDCRCSCQPCLIWWMCPPRCPSTCCNRPPPPSCCSCPTCVPWMPCSPCKCTSNCCPGSNCCSGNGCDNNNQIENKKTEKKEPIFDEQNFPRLQEIRDRLRNERY